MFGATDSSYRVDSYPVNNSPAAINFDQPFPTLRKMSSNTSSDGLERKLSALGEKDIEIGEPLSSGASENDRCDSGKHISIWVIVNILATVAIVSLKAPNSFTYRSKTLVHRAF